MNVNGTTDYRVEKTQCGRRLVFAWKADASGVHYEIDGRLVGGELWRVVTEPQDVSAAYDLTFEDQTGKDLLNGQGADRSTTDTETIFPFDTASPNTAVAEQLNGLYRLKIDGASSGDYGVVYVDLKDRSV